MTHLPATKQMQINTIDARIIQISQDFHKTPADKQPALRNILNNLTRQMMELKQ